VSKETITNFQLGIMAPVSVLFFCALSLSAQAPGLITSIVFSGADGSHPRYMALVQATDGNMYGTTFRGGAYGEGTIFRFTPPATLTTLHSFSGTDGAHPEAGLIHGADGKLYGTTYAGGGFKKGTVFSMTLDRALVSYFT
jgi:uncharacterized repeat protein (TIGR03803 family)